MINFYEIKPLDTLFFRGSTPMEAGQYNAVSIFPPPVSVIKGAFWTEYCNVNNKDFSTDLINGEIPIDVVGLCIMKNKKLYIPSPSTWYYDSEEKYTTCSQFDKVPLIKACDRKNEFEKMGISTSAGNVVFVTPKWDAKPLINSYLSIDFIKNKKKEINKEDILLTSDIYTLENRTGNGLDDNKHTVEGKLYTSSHVRLREDISIVVILDSDIELKEGKFIFGGERRISEYKKIDKISLIDSNDNTQYLSLAPILATEDSMNELVSSSKLVTVAGWDLQKGFHKPSVSYIPSGAVFNKKINNSCIPLV